MCIRCSNEEAIDFRTVPIKHLLAFLEKKELIFDEYNTDRFIDVVWFVDPVDFGFIASVEYDMEYYRGMQETLDLHFPVDNIPLL